MLLGQPPAGRPANNALIVRINHRARGWKKVARAARKRRTLGARPPWARGRPGRPLRAGRRWRVDCGCAVRAPPGRPEPASSISARGRRRISERPKRISRRRFDRPSGRGLAGAPAGRSDRIGRCSADCSAINCAIMRPTGKTHTAGRLARARRRTEPNEGCVSAGASGASACATVAARARLLIDC